MQPNPNYSDFSLVTPNNKFSTFKCLISNIEYFDMLIRRGQNSAQLDCSDWFVGVLLDRVHGGVGSGYYGHINQQQLYELIDMSDFLGTENKLYVEQFKSAFVKGCTDEEYLNLILKCDYDTSIEACIRGRMPQNWNKKPQYFMNAQEFIDGLTEYISKSHNYGETQNFFCDWIGHVKEYPGGHREELMRLYEILVQPMLNNRSWHHNRLTRGAFDIKQYYYLEPD